MLTRGSAAQEGNVVNSATSEALTPSDSYSITGSVQECVRGQNPRIRVSHFGVCCILYKNVSSSGILLHARRSFWCEPNGFLSTERPAEKSKGIMAWKKFQRADHSS